MDPSQVLIVEGGSETARYLRGLVSSSSISSAAVASESEAVERLRKRIFCAVVLHLDGMPLEGRHLFTTVQRESPNTPVIVIAQRAADLAEWSAAGAFDCLVEPVDRPALLAVLDRARTRTELCTGNNLSPMKAPSRRSPPPFAELIGDSEAMQTVYHWVSKVASSDANVCLYGESGTGKELIARALHESGGRRGRPFVVLDCAAIPEGLMESEMFGHVRGAFTSAVGDRVGVFQLADTGTLFLDEVAELPLPLQAKLLRVIQHREFRRVGSSHSLRVDVRIVTATNQDLPELVKAGRFREDLFYRLDVISITLPPLRQRKEDIPLLVDHFVQQFNHRSARQIRGVTARTLRLLLQYDWPGNVRELQNCIERAGVMADGDFIDISQLRQVLHPGLRTTFQGDHGSTLRDRQKTQILDALRQTRGNKTAAAALLGISLRGLYYKLRGLDRDKNAGGNRLAEAGISR
ncbi:MAG: sigma-54-dependent Fis family transcriptional regulator [candidate division NC10 bacterium]|nr:sigma-54-dependent Fis family transcriptional regulator [candidate division NC10 bacterium]